MGLVKAYESVLADVVLQIVAENLAAVVVMITVVVIIVVIKNHNSKFGSSSYGDNGSGSIISRSISRVCFLSVVVSLLAADGWWVGIFCSGGGVSLC